MNVQAASRMTHEVCFDTRACREGYCCPTNLSMFYARWQQIAAEYSSGTALVECQTGLRWTFRELSDLAERLPPAEALVLPSGRNVGFILGVLRAWRDHRPLCPLDVGQAMEVAPGLPPGIVHLKLTSATTGVPRLVGFTAAQLEADVEKIVEMMGLRPDLPNLGVISLAHSYGFSNLVLPLLLHGIPLILAESALPEALRQAVCGWEGVTLAAVPALWKSWNDANAIPASVRLAISAGAALPIALEEAVFSRTGLKIHNFYGATECGGIAYDPTNEPRQEEAWVGEVMPGIKLSTLDDGCLEVSGKSVGYGYIPADLRHLKDGRYRTRDLAKVGPDGVRLNGRASDLINVAGRKVAPEAIESVLMKFPGVRACVVFGAPDAGTARQDRVVAVVAASNGVTESALRAHAIHWLPDWQVPREWRRVSEIPPNVRGKVARATWRSRFLAGELEAPFSSGAFGLA